MAPVEIGKKRGSLSWRDLVKASFILILDEVTEIARKCSGPESLIDDEKTRNIHYIIGCAHYC